jgi:two-component system, NarL family, response regulator NreC
VWRRTTEADWVGTTEPRDQKPLTVVLADDHVVVRSGLRLLLESEPGLAVVGECGDVDGALAAVAELSPDVLVLDLHMPGEPSLAAIPRLRELHSGTRVIVLTAQHDPSFAAEALRLGASGYLPKEAADGQLLEAIQVAAEGGTYLEPRLGARLAAVATRQPAELSERELEVLRLIARGLTNREIAERLFLSVRTVESHRARLQRKLELTRRSELVEYALERGLVEPSELPS